MRTHGNCRILFLALIALGVAVFLPFKRIRALTVGECTGKMRGILGIVLIAFCVSAMLRYQGIAIGESMPSPEPQRPLLVKHGWEFPTVTFVSENIRTMEKRPVDGVAISMDDNLSEKVMRTEPISYAQFAENLRPLAKLNSPTLKHNFIIVFATPAGNIFEEGWDVVVQNFGNLARAAKEVGVEGIFFDIEEYFGDALVYPTNCGEDKTVEEARSKMRERGRQIMDAMRAEWSDVRFLSTHGPYLSDSATFQFLAENGMPANDVAWANVMNASLLVGMMQSAYGTEARFIDGGEFYGARTLEQFQAIKYWQKDGMAKYSEIIPEDFRPYWSNALSSSFGIYDACDDMDAATWKSTVTNALKTADDYVWLYSERYDWWREENCWPETPLPEAWDDATKEALQAANLQGS
ncbi:MAG: hypothetical protein ACOYI8_01325 [Christensenellales bacterium]|jgi:hypothetical protein